MHPKLSGPKETENTSTPNSESVVPPDNLRDWFAGQALIGCLAYSHYNESWGDYHNNGSHADLAHKCYAQADAMLAAREASNG